MAPFDAELNFVPNPSGFRSNPSNIANPDRKYFGNHPEKSLFCQ
jgi:hypothetical protein